MNTLEAWYDLSKQQDYNKRFLSYQEFFNSLGFNEQSAACLAIASFNSSIVRRVLEEIISNSSDVENCLRQSSEMKICSLLAQVYSLDSLIEQSFDSSVLETLGFSAYRCSLEVLAELSRLLVLIEVYNPGSQATKDLHSQRSKLERALIICRDNAALNALDSLSERGLASELGLI
jgi:hypothetical protein